jgi:transcription elongation factor GreB
MGRFRAPQAAGSQYITPQGARRLRGELDQLWRVERPRVTQAVAEAAAQGDRSENAEYTYGKRRLREIDRRVRFLRKRLEGMVIVDQPPTDCGRVFFGAWVSLESEEGLLSRYRIVGPDELDMDSQYISMDAPLGRALLRRALDDEVTVDLPGGRRTFVIVQIDYATLAPPENESAASDHDGVATESELRLNATKAPERS